MCANSLALTAVIAVVLPSLFLTCRVLDIPVNITPGINNLSEHEWTTVHVVLILFSGSQPLENESENIWIALHSNFYCRVINRDYVKVQLQKIECKYIQGLLWHRYSRNSKRKLLREEPTLGRAIAMKEYIFVDGVNSMKKNGCDCENYIGTT